AGLAASERMRARQTGHAKVALRARARNRERRPSRAGCAAVRIESCDVQYHSVLSLIVSPKELSQDGLNGELAPRHYMVLSAGLTLRLATLNRRNADASSYARQAWLASLSQLPHHCAPAIQARTPDDHRHRTIQAAAAHRLCRMPRALSQDRTGVSRGEGADQQALHLE